jgi:hypothetical protein
MTPRRQGAPADEVHAAPQPDELAPRHHAVDLTGRVPECPQLLDRHDRLLLGSKLVQLIPTTFLLCERRNVVQISSGHRPRIAQNA